MAAPRLPKAGSSSSSLKDMSPTLYPSSTSHNQFMPKGHGCRNCPVLSKLPSSGLGRRTGDQSQATEVACLDCYAASQSPNIEWLLAATQLALSEALQTDCGFEWRHGHAALATCVLHAANYPDMYHVCGDISKLLHSVSSSPPQACLLAAKSSTSFFQNRKQPALLGSYSSSSRLLHSATCVRCCPTRQLRKQGHNDACFCF